MFPVQNEAKSAGMEGETKWTQDNGNVTLVIMGFFILLLIVNILASENTLFFV